MRTLTCPSDRAFGIYVIDPPDPEVGREQDVVPAACGPAQLHSKPRFSISLVLLALECSWPRERQVGNSRYERTQRWQVQRATRCEGLDSNRGPLERQHPLGARRLRNHVCAATRSSGPQGHSRTGWATGFEPATSGTTIRRSNRLSYAHQSASAHVFAKRVNVYNERRMVKPRAPVSTAFPRRLMHGSRSRA